MPFYLQIRTTDAGITPAGHRAVHALTAVGFYEVKEGS